MRIFPERFDHNPALRFLGGAFIALGAVSVVLTGLAMHERFSAVESSETMTIASVAQTQSLSDSEIQSIEPAAGNNAEQTILILR